MQKEGQQKLLFVINPVSGGKEKRDWEAFIRDFFKELPHSIEFYLLTGESDEVSVQHHIQTVKPDKVVAVGGDGTVKMVAEIIKGTPIALGILPAGSANGMAKELGIPLTKNEALEVVINGQRKNIDSIQVNGEEMCIHLSDAGLNAMLVKYFEDTKKRGMWGYAKGVFKVLWNKRKLYATITTDEGTYHRKAYMIVLANARQYGTGATINPEGKVDDGYFEVVVVRKLNFWGLLNTLITHRKFDKEKAEIFSTKKAELTLLKKAYFQVDGEYRGRTKSITASIAPNCLSIMVPQNETGNVA
jgi:YegS/Rv2252/BmrU family lipid kinase